MQIYADSLTYHCSLHQSDRDLPYLLMLHGFMGSSKVFDHLIEELSVFCNPITLDLAGHGRTESPKNPTFYTAERQVHQLHSIISRLQFNNLWIYGYSMGGRLAFQLLSSHPELFSGAIIESSHCGIQDEPKRSKRKIVDEERAQQIEKKISGFIDGWMNAPLFKHTPDNFKEMYEEIMRNQRYENMSASLRGFGAGVMPNVCKQIQNCKLPLHLIAGEFDQKYSDIAIKTEHSVNSACATIVEKAGHRVHTDQPVAVVSIIKRMIEQNF